MKKSLLLVLLSCCSFLGFSSTWYSASAGGDAATLTKWWSTAAGTGSNPTTFTAPGDIWIVQSAMTLSASAWGVSGPLTFNMGGSLTKSGSSSTTITVQGSTTLTHSSFITSGAGAGSIILNLYGDLNVLDTSYISTGAPGISYNFIYFINTATTYSAPQHITWSSISTSFYTNLYVNYGVFVQLSSNLPVPKNANAGLTVNGELICGTYVISSGGTAPFTLKNTGTICTGHVLGLNGTVTSMSSVYFSYVANFVYNGTLPQFTGTYLPANINVSAGGDTGTVTIDNSAGVSLSQNTLFSPSTKLRLNRGTLNNTATNLAIYPGCYIYRDSGKLAVTPSTYAAVNLIYANLGNNASMIAADNEFPASFYGTVTVDKAGDTVALNGNKVLNGTVTLTNGVLDASASNYSLSLNGTWTNNAGINGLLPRGGAVIFNGTSAQSITGSSATTFNNLTINNASGVSLGASEIVNNTLTLTTGLLTLGSNNLTLGATATAVAGTPSAINMVVTNGAGQLRKIYTAASAYTFPVGDVTTGYYSPVTITFTAGTFAANAYAGASVVPAKEPHNANLTAYLNRYWAINTSGVTSGTYNAAGTYNASDVTGTETAMSAGKYAGISWAKYGAVNATTHTLTATAVADANANITGISSASPSLVLSAPSVICSGTGSTPINVTTVTGDPTLVFTWSPATGLSATTGAAVTASPLSTTTYTVVVTDGNGFTASATATVSVNPSPAAPSGTTLICQGSFSTLTVSGGGGTWQSSNTLVAQVGSSTGVVSGLNVGTANISYIYPTGCYSYATVTVNIPPAAIIGDSFMCVGDIVTLHDAVASGSWSSLNTAVVTINSTNGVDTAIAPGVVNITYNTGCAPATKTVTVNPRPAAIAGSSNLCNGAHSTLLDITPGGIWHSSDTTIAKIDSASGVALGVSLGTAVISYILPATGCEITHAVTVNPLAPITGVDTICQGSSAVFADIVGGGTWMSSNHDIATADTFTGHVHAVDSGNTYIIYTTAAGCETSYLVRISPALPAIAGPSHVCTGSTIALSNGVAGGVWSSNNTFAATVNDSTGVLIGHSPDTVRIVYTKPWGCIASKLVTVNQLPVPTVSYVWATHSLVTNSYYVSYQWYSTTSGLIGGANADIYGLPYHNDSFYVVVTDTNGCTGSSGKLFYNFSAVPTVTAIPVQLYPNPTTGMVHIATPVQVNVTVSTIDGKEVMTRAHATDINISDMPPGMYFLTVVDDGGQILTRDKIIKE